MVSVLVLSDTFFVLVLVIVFAAISILSVVSVAFGFAVGYWFGLQKRAAYGVYNAGKWTQNFDEAKICSGNGGLGGRGGDVGSHNIIADVVVVKR